MTRRLPPLNAVRAFEAAGRHLSFTRAANELGVTPAAISQQIKVLEGHLGVQLFRRLNKGLLMTDAAQRCLGELCDCLNHMADIFSRAEGRGLNSILSVRVSPSFASNWLVQRLHRFHSKHPDIDIRLLTSTQIVCLDSPDIDVAITYTVAPAAESKADQLMLEEVYPVCSPHLIKAGRTLTHPAQLRDFPLIHDETLRNEVTFPTWAMWLRRTRATAVEAERGPRFSLSSMALQATLEGQGVMLGRSILVADDLASGRLIKPFSIRYPAQFAYCIEIRDAARTQPVVAAFIAWLRAEAAAAKGNVASRRTPRRGSARGAARPASPRRTSA